MAKKLITAIGIEYDSLSIRAAKVTTMRKHRKLVFLLDGLQELTGDFSKDEALVQAFREMSEKIGIKPRDRLVASVSGKQVFVTQLKFKTLPVNEMKNALRFEIRKTLPFEAAGAAIDYHIIDKGEPEKKGKPNVTVTAVANPLVDRLVRSLDKAGFKPWIIDVLPLAVANAFWVSREASQPQAAHVMLHFAPDMCNVVIDSVTSPLYARSVYFTAEEIFGSAGSAMPEGEKKRLDGLGEELRRSLSFYEKTYGVGTFGLVYVAGNYARQTDLLALIREKLGLSLDETPLLERIGSKMESIPGKFDVAVTLALRGKEIP